MNFKIVPIFLLLAVEAMTSGSIISERQEKVRHKLKWTKDRLMYYRRMTLKSRLDNSLFNQVRYNIENKLRHPTKRFNRFSGYHDKE